MTTMHTFGDATLKFAVIKEKGQNMSAFLE